MSSWTVRRILARAGIASPRRRRPPEHRVRRERMPREGMLLQVDGSHHAWLEERGPRFALLLAVDDATGAAVHALFRPVEDARGYFLLLEEIVRRCGIPLALYSDRHGVFKASSDGRRGLRSQPNSQFARAMRELGITIAEAQTVLERFLPRFNARFRVPAAEPEVAYRPLDRALPLASILGFRHPRSVARDNTVKYRWRTLQLLPGRDRLVTELSDASASTIAEAQTVLERFLPRFNARFRVPAAEPEVAYRPLDRALPLASILGFRHPRSVARDNTVKYRWRTLQLLPGRERTSYAGARVEVLERPGGELSVLHQGETIPSREAPPRAGVLRAARSELARNPDHERIASGLGAGGAPRRLLPALPAATAAVKVASNRTTSRPETGSKQLRAPTPRQLARWKAIQQAQLQGLSMRATARLLGISRDTVRSYVRANGVPGRQNGAAASSDGDGGTDKVAARSCTDHFRIAAQRH